MTRVLGFLVLLLLMVACSSEEEEQLFSKFNTQIFENSKHIYQVEGEDGYNLMNEKGEMLFSEFLEMRDIHEKEESQLYSIGRREFFLLKNQGKWKLWKGLDMVPRMLFDFQGEQYLLVRSGYSKTAIYDMQMELLSSINIDIPHRIECSAHYCYLRENVSWVFIIDKNFEKAGRLFIEREYDLESHPQYDHIIYSRSEWTPKIFNLKSGESLEIKGTENFRVWNYYYSFLKASIESGLDSFPVPVNPKEDLERWSPLMEKNEAFKEKIIKDSLKFQYFNLNFKPNSNQIYKQPELQKINAHNNLESDDDSFWIYNYKDDSLLIDSPEKEDEEWVIPRPKDKLTYHLGDYWNNGLWSLKNLGLFKKDKMLLNLKSEYTDDMNHFQVEQLSPKILAIWRKYPKLVELSDSLTVLIEGRYYQIFNNNGELLIPHYFDQTPFDRLEDTTALLKLEVDGSFLKPYYFDQLGKLMFAPKPIPKNTAPQIKDRTDFEKEIKALELEVISYEKDGIQYLLNSLGIDFSEEWHFQLYHFNAEGYRSAYIRLEEDAFTEEDFQSLDFVPLEKGDYLVVDALKQNSTSVADYTYDLFIFEVKHDIYE